MIIAFTAHPLVHLNAALNALATVLLVVGWLLVRQGRHAAHGRVMLAAFLVSCLFLVSYLAYHALAGSVRFTHPGPIKVVYLALLLSHVVLAAVVPFLAVAVITWAILGKGFRLDAAPADDRLRRYLARHSAWARWTLPIWLYVSLTGVVVYLMLYHLWPPTGP